MSNWTSDDVGDFVRFQRAHPIDENGNPLDSENIAMNHEDACNFYGHQPSRVNPSQCDCGAYVFETE